GENVREWLYDEDHVRALWEILWRGRLGEKYNVGGHNEWANIDVVRRICTILDGLSPAPTGGHGSLIPFVADRPGHELRYAIEAGKIAAERGWSPRQTFETGLEKTVRWYIENPQWWRPLREKTYDGRRLGLIEKRPA